MENSEKIATEELIPQRTGKTPFKIKTDDKGLILTIHHTVEENNNYVRVRLVVACFHETKKHFITVDNRGNIFVFDLATKNFWKLLETVTKACIIRSIPDQPDVYLIGTRTGRIYWVDVEKPAIVHSDDYSSDRISNISFPGIPLTPHLAVVHSNHAAILLNVDTFEASHRLEFNQNKISLKFVSYIPQSDQIFTCFTNDSVHIWSGITLHTIRVHNPIRSRDRYLMNKSPQSIRLNDSSSQAPCDASEDEIKDFSRGLINSYNFSTDGAVVCFSTLDNYLLFLSTVSYELLKVIKLFDATVKASWLFSKPNECILCCQTTKSQLVLLDISSSGIKLVVEESKCFRTDVSKDRELLYAIKETGEANIYSVSAIINTLKSAQNCVKMFQKSLWQHKAISVCSFDSELKKILTRNRLIPFLKEYGQYPSKYRNLMWTALLEIPGNKGSFCDLVRMGTHPAAAALEKSLHLKDLQLRRNLIKIFSCLAHWTKVFGHSSFLPSFIFPFVKVYSNNLTTCFEIIATILVNQCQLWFEFHPLEPLNYLGICENVLSQFDPQLWKFYGDIGVTAKEYAWRILSTGFSEVLDDEHWLCLWDHVLSAPPYFLLFCTVAYSLMQRDTIMRMTDNLDIVDFFSEQNALNMRKLIMKAYWLMEMCPNDLHPRRYMNEFVKLPKGVYPKFQNYPKKWVEMQESEMDAIRKEHQMIDARIRELERDEAMMIEKLERGLQLEEHSKRMKEMQTQYQEVLKREEERVACQRKVLTLCQKELRKRKGKVIELFEKSSNKTKENLQEAELNTLLSDVERGRQRDERDLRMVEELVKDDELNWVAYKYGVEELFRGGGYEPMRQQFKESVLKLDEEKKKLTVTLQNILHKDAKENVDLGRVPSKLSQLESKIQELENEFKSAL